MLIVKLTHHLFGWDWVHFGSRIRKIRIAPNGKPFLKYNGSMTPLSEFEGLYIPITFKGSYADHLSKLNLEIITKEISKELNEKDS